jgi:hypothetical protein
MGAALEMRSSALHCDACCFVATAQCAGNPRKASAVTTGWRRVSRPWVALFLLSGADPKPGDGPEGGDHGGRVVAVGTPEDVAQTRGSYTGEFLRPLLLGRAA